MEAVNVGTPTAEASPWEGHKGRAGGRGGWEWDAPTVAVWRGYTRATTHASDIEGAGKTWAVAPPVNRLSARPCDRTAAL